MSDSTGSALDREFDRLKKIEEISLNEDLVMFVEKSRSSLQPQSVSSPRDYFKRSLLHYAAMGNCVNLLYYLLRSAPDIESRDVYRRTPLSYAAEHCSLDVVKILLERGAEVNARDYAGSTPLTYLIYTGNPESTCFAATEVYLKERGAKEDTMF